MNQSHRGLVLVLALVIGGWLSPPPLSAQSVTRVSPEQKQQQELSKTFRETRDHARRMGLIRRADGMGPAAVELLHGFVLRDLFPKLSTYRTAFGNAASQTLAQRLGPSVLQEVPQLRQQLNTLRKDTQLTREKIESLADPAMNRLGQLLMFDRMQVLARNRELQQLRQELLPLGEQWEALERLRIRDQAEDEAPPLDFQMRLSLEEQIASVMAITPDAAARDTLVSNMRVSVHLDPAEAQCIHDLNLNRVLMGLPPLAIDLQLTAAARDHSSDMKSHRFFSHQSPVAGKTSFTQRAQNFGTTASGENIASVGPRSQTVLKAWWYSPGHMRNMLGDHRRIGVGRSDGLWTMLLGT